MFLSNNFTIKELTATLTGLPNEPDPIAKDKLFYLCQFILQDIRTFWGVINIGSGFRSKEVNKAIGGRENSQHMLGEAADIIPRDSDIEDVFNWCIKVLKFGQCILETKQGKRWIHISLPRLNGQNQQAMIYEEEEGYKEV